MSDVRPIDANAFAISVALYMAENAYLNDTALDVLKKVVKWLEEEPTLDYDPRQKWISVKDRLPEDNQRVLFIPTCNQGSIYVGQYAYVGRDGGVMFAHRDGRSRTNYYAKYWIPLPKPPKE